MKAGSNSSSPAARLLQCLALLRCKRRSLAAASAPEAHASQPRILGSRSLSCPLDSIKHSDGDDSKKSSVPSAPDAEFLQSSPRLPEPCPEPSPLHTSCPGTESETEPEPLEKSEAEPEPLDTLPQKATSRPTFQKPTREVRLRQITEELREFCELDFDEVNPEQQSGLACRMMVLLKSLRRDTCIWENGVRSETTAFELLGLSQVDMSLVKRVLERAEKWVDENRWRQVYQELCRARPVVLQKGADRRSDACQKLVSKLEEKTTCKPCSPMKVDEVWRNTAPAGPKPAVDSKKNGRLPASDGGRGGGKYLCRVKIGIEEDPRFQVCRRIIGPGGENMKRIVESNGKDGSVKLRLRGKGSKYLEGPENKESSDPLMLCVSATTRKSFDRAAQAVESLLALVHEDYRSHCQAAGKSVPNLLPARREGQRSR